MQAPLVDKSPGILVLSVSLQTVKLAESHSMETILKTHNDNPKNTCEIE